MGRLLITLMLCDQRALQKPVLYLSHYFRQHRQTCYDRLQAARETSAWEGWLRFFLLGVREVAKEARDTAQSILNLREHHRQLITNHLDRAAANGHRLLEQLYRMPCISVPAVRDSLQINFRAANHLVARLEQLGILTEFTGQKRNRLFAYDACIRLFTG